MCVSCKIDLCIANSLISTRPTKYCTTIPYTLWVKKLDSFSFEHNFRKYCPILIILLLLQAEIISPHTCYWIAHFTYSLLLHYLEKCNRIQFFIETVESICNACSNFIVVTKPEILVIFLTDAGSRRHNDVILLPAIRKVSGNDFMFQQDSAPSHHAVHVQHLNCCVKKRQTFLHPTCGLQTAPISVLWITRSGLSCSVVSTTDKSVVWMNWTAVHRCMVRSWTVDFWRGYFDQWRGGHRACVHVKGEFRVQSVNWQG